MNDKKSFIKSFLPDTVNDLQLVHIDFEQTGLTICDILRNINRIFPVNSKSRYEIIDGHKVIAVICHSDLIEPIHGIVLIIGHDIDIQVESKNYILITVDESDIRDEETLNDVNDSIFMYLAKTLRTGIHGFDEFYLKYLYNDYENERYEDN